jgi:hypothetical protein
MPTRFFRPRALVVIAAGYLCLEAVCILLSGSHQMVASYPFKLMAPWLAFAAICWRARRSRLEIRLPWAMVSAGIFLWAIGMALSAWEDLKQYAPASIAYFSDFIFILYGVPILLAISSPPQDEQVQLFIWLDGIQAVVSACLLYMMLFSALPFMRQSVQPISVSSLVRTYSIENLGLAFASTACHRSRGRSFTRRHFPSERYWEW